MTVLIFQFLDQFFDLTGHLITPGDEEGIGGIDDDEVFDADSGDESIITLDEKIFTAKVDVFAMDDGMIS